MTGTDDGLMEALSRVDPARADLPPAKGSIRYNSILEAAMNDDGIRDYGSARQPRRSTTRRWRARRLAFACAAGAVVALAGVMTAVMLLTGGPAGITNITPALAAEAVKKAAVDTAAAGDSGVVETVLRGLISTNDGAQAAFGAEPELVDGVLVSRTFAWNGEDLAIEVGPEGGQAYEIRYVDGRFYERGYFVPDREDWFHCPDFDNGGGYDPGPDAANEAFIPAEWLADYRSALVGSGLMDLVDSVNGLAAVPSDDGGTTYTGTLPVGELSTASLGLSGLPFAGQPLDKLRQLDPALPVAVEVQVDSDGLIGRARLSYELEGNPFVDEATYSQLGSAPAISAPDPAQTATTDSPFEVDGQ
jgi:hypothetical protein